MSSTMRAILIIITGSFVLLILAFVLCLILYYSGAYNFGIGEDNVSEIVVNSQLNIVTNPTVLYSDG
jgi:hypothetical protein